MRRTEEQSHITKLIVAYRNYANEIEKVSHKYCIISIVNRTRNSHYHGLATNFPECLSYSKESTCSLTSDNVCTVRC